MVPDADSSAGVRTELRVITLLVAALVQPVGEAIGATNRARLVTTETVAKVVASATMDRTAIT